MPRACSDLVQSGRPEHALAGLVDDDLAGAAARAPAMMSAPGSPAISTRPIGPASPMRRLGAPRSRLAGGQSDEVGPVRLARVHDRPAARAPGREQRGDRRDRRLQPRHVVAERGAEAAGLDEVALHVDDDQRACGPARRRTRTASRRARTVVMRRSRRGRAPPATAQRPRSPWCASPPMCAPIVRRSAPAPASRRRSGLRSSRRCGRDSSSSSSRSSLTSSTAAPRARTCDDAGVDLARRRRSRGRTPG